MLHTCGQIRVSFFLLRVKTQIVTVRYLHMTEVLIRSNELCSQDDRIYVLILGSHMTGVVVCYNEKGSQATFARFWSHNDMRANMC